MRYSSGLIKPDGVERGLEREIFEWMESSGLKVVLHKALLLKERDIRVLYHYCYGMEHYKDLESFLMSGPATFYVVFSVSGDAVELLNRLVGSTDPKKSLRETIRGRYGRSVARNVIHSTQNTATLLKDLNHFLTREEVLKILM